jgi:hypothetical protein
MSPGVRKTLVVAGSALAGGVVGLLVGLVAIAVSPDNGFGDLAAAAVTTVFLIPLGFIVGGVVGWLLIRRVRRGAV